MIEGIRVECGLDGLTNNWIEVDPVWTRGELRAFVELTGDEYWSLWQRKVIDCHIELAYGGVIERPEDVELALDNIDIRLVRWLSAAVLMATQHLLNLGEASARLSSHGVGVAVPTTMTTH
jgi:hypothetical protein